MGVVQRSRSSDIPLFISPPDHGVSPATGYGGLGPGAHPIAQDRTILAAALDHAGAS